MDMLTYCRAMAAFCRQRSTFEGENDAFWIREAEEWDELISECMSLESQIQIRPRVRHRRAMAVDHEDVRLSGR